MTLCPLCDAPLVPRRVSLPASTFGYPSGTLHNLERLECGQCGETALAVPAAGAVERALREQLTQLDRALTGEEFAFLRRTLGYSGQGYAALVGVSNVTVSRVENAEAVTAHQDRLVRALTLLALHQPAALTLLAARGVQEAQVDAAVLAPPARRAGDSGWFAVPVAQHPAAQVRVHHRVPDAWQRVDMREAREACA